MATVGVLNVFVNAITKKFDDGIGSVHKQLRSLTKGFADINGFVQTAKMGFDAAAKVVSAFNEEIERLDDLVDTANRLGVTADSLQKFHRAAVIASGDVESMNKALAVFQRNLGDAALGQAGPARAFARLGLNAQELSNVGLDQAFTTALARLGEFPNAAERASIGADLFGKSSANLTDLMANGSSAMQQATNDLNQYGVALNNSVEDIDRARRAKEQFDMAWSGLTTQATLAGAPAGALLMSGAATGIAGARNISSGDALMAILTGNYMNALGRGIGRSMMPDNFQTPQPLPVSPVLPEQGPQSDALDGYMRGWSLRSRRNGPSQMQFANTFYARELLNARFDKRSINVGGATPALEFGSQAAFSAVNQSRREDEMAKLQKQEIEETKKTNKILERGFENAIILSELDLQG